MTYAVLRQRGLHSTLTRVAYTTLQGSWFVPPPSKGYKPLEALFTMLKDVVTCGLIVHEMADIMFVSLNVYRVPGIETLCGPKGQYY